MVDMFSGIDLNNGYDLNNYQDIGQVIFPKFREICKKYNFTILLIHHLNKNNSALGSTAVDGATDGILTLTVDSNIKNKIILNYRSRDYEIIELFLKRKENLVFEVSEIETNDLNNNLIIFLNYAIKQKEFTFTVSEIIGKLNLMITPSAFGRLLNSNITNLEKEGLYIEKRRNGDERTYYARYKEPNI